MRLVSFAMPILISIKLNIFIMDKYEHVICLKQLLQNKVLQTCFP